MARRMKKRFAVLTTIAACLCALAMLPGLAYASEEQPISDGVYTIASAANPTEVLDVVAGLQDPGANITLWQTYGAERQKYQFTYRGDGYYSITVVHSGQSIDVVASGQSEGTNVTQWPYYGTDNQLWRVSLLADGSYRIVSKCNELALSWDGSAEDGANVMVGPVGSSADTWNLSPLSLTGAQTVSDGVYELSTSGNSECALGVDGSSISRGANALMTARQGLQSQKVRLAYQDDGTYLVEFLHSDQALDVVASSMKPGTNVTQWTRTAADNQRWVVIDNGDGTYRFVSRCNGLSLTSDVGESANMYVQVWTDSDAQRITLTPANVLADGNYRLHLADNSSFVADVVAGSQDAGANVTLWTANDNKWQNFEITYLNNGYYRILSKNSSQSLDVVASGTFPGTNVTQWTDAGTTNQQWSITQNADGSYRIVSRCNDLPLCAEAAEDGGNLCVGTKDAESCCSWTFEDKGEDFDGVYTLNLASNSTYVCDVVAGSTDEGANVTLWEKTGVNWQKFRLTSVGDGYYKIVAAHSGQVLDVVAAGQDPGTNVTQWSYFGNDNQLWSIEGNASSGYRLKSKCNGLYLTVDISADSLNGANVYVDEGKSDGSQVFSLEATSAQEITYKQYDFTLSDLLSWQKESSYATYSDEDGLYYLNPDTFDSSTNEFYRFADLRGYSGLTAEAIDSYISSTDRGRTGTLAGMGQAFVDGAKSAQVNEAMLLSIAILESGWGQSWLSSGVYYDGNGFTAKVWDSDAGEYVYEWVDYPGYEPGTYYNFFGIGAYDSDPMRGGMKKAISEGWNSVPNAIKGAASWIAKFYIYADEYPQETLYEIHWDIDRSQATRSRGYHQYTTTLNWDAYLAANFMARIYAKSGVLAPNVSFIVPKYQ